MSGKELFVAKSNQYDSLFVGYILGIVSIACMTISIVQKKVSLLNLNKKSNLSEGIKLNMFKSELWWASGIAWFLGEVLIAIASSCAPASAILPLSSLTIAGVLCYAWFTLNESVQPKAVIAAIVLVLGCACVTIFGPRERVVNSLTQWISNIQATSFMMYICCMTLIIGSTFLYTFMVPQNQLHELQVIVAGLLSSLVFILWKGLYLSFEMLLAGEINTLGNPIIWLCIMLFILGMVMQAYLISASLLALSCVVYAGLFYTTMTANVLIVCGLVYDEFILSSPCQIRMVIIGGFLSSYATILLAFTTYKNEFKRTSTFIGKKYYRRDWILVNVSPLSNKVRGLRRKTL